MVRVHSAPFKDREMAQLTNLQEHTNATEKFLQTCTKHYMPNIVMHLSQAGNSVPKKAFISPEIYIDRDGNWWSEFIQIKSPILNFLLFLGMWR